MQKYSVVIPVLNQLKYTQQCLESLMAAGTAKEQVLVIDNASTDDSSAWLQQQGYPFLRNSFNFGCGGAWAQGAMRSTAEWVIFLNNDVVLCDAFCDRLIAAAERLGCDVISPGMVENELDYDVAAYAQEYLSSMAGLVRHGKAHGVCFAVRSSLFSEVGFPDTDRALGGHEDSEYFLRCLAAGKKLAITGSCFLHHFGSITQKAMKLESDGKALGSRKALYRKVGMGWLRRKLWKLNNQRRNRQWVRQELALTGRTLHMNRLQGSWTYN